MPEIGRVSLIVEIDGEVCAVALPQERLQLVVDMAAGLSDTGRLPVRKLGKDYRFEVVHPLPKEEQCG